MIWRKTSPLAGQLLELSEVVRRSAGVSGERHQPTDRQGTALAARRLAKDAAPKHRAPQPQSACDAGSRSADAPGAPPLMKNRRLVR
jgi:hypothetical protein